MLSHDAHTQGYEGLQPTPLQGCTQTPLGTGAGDRPCQFLSLKCLGGWAVRVVRTAWAALIVPWLCEDDMETQVYTGRRE